jgi:hypothetical protein
MLFLTNLAGFFSWQPGRILGQNPFFSISCPEKNPAGQEYEIPAGISCQAAGKNGPARLLRNGLIGSINYWPLLPGDYQSKIYRIYRKFMKYYHGRHHESHHESEIGDVSNRPLTPFW